MLAYLFRGVALFISLACIYGVIHFIPKGNLGVVGLLVATFAFTNCYALFGRWRAHSYSEVPVEALGGYEIFEAVMKRIYVFLVLIAAALYMFAVIVNVLFE